MANNGRQPPGRLPPGPNPRSALWSADYDPDVPTPITFSGHVNPEYRNFQGRGNRRRRAAGRQPQLGDVAGARASLRQQGLPPPVIPAQGVVAQVQPVVPQVAQAQANAAQVQFQSSPPVLPRRTPLFSSQLLGVGAPSTPSPAIQAARRAELARQARPAGFPPRTPLRPRLIQETSESFPFLESSRQLPDVAANLTEDLSDDNNMPNVNQEEPQETSGLQEDSLTVNFDANTQDQAVGDRFGDEVLLYQPSGTKWYLYNGALRQGCLAAVILALTQANSMGSPVVANADDSVFRELGRNILWSMPLEILVALTSGNLASASRRSPVLRELFHDNSPWIQESTVQAPVIYVLLLVDQAGESPTPPQLRQVIASLRAYVSDEPGSRQGIIEIDQAFGAGRSSRNQVEQGYQRFMHRSKNGKRTQVKNRAEIVEQFCSTLETRLDAIGRAGDGRRPLRRPLMYVGYAFKYADRMQEHDHGESSFLMQLVKSVCQVLFPRIFNLEPFPVCFIAEEVEVRVAELLVTQLADSFSWTGGFNIHPPGINNSSADMLEWSKGAAVDFWADRREFRRDMSFWEEARAREMDDVERRYHAKEAPRENLTGSEPASQAYYGLQQARQNDWQDSIDDVEKDLAVEIDEFGQTKLQELEEMCRLFEENREGIDTEILKEFKQEAARIRRDFKAYEAHRAAQRPTVLPSESSGPIAGAIDQQEGLTSPPMPHSSHNELYDD